MSLLDNSTFLPELLTFEITETSLILLRALCLSCPGQSKRRSDRGSNFVPRIESFENLRYEPTQAEYAHRQVAAETPHQESGGAERRRRTKSRIWRTRHSCGGRRKRWRARKRSPRPRCRFAPSASLLLRPAFLRLRCWFSNRSRCGPADGRVPRRSFVHQLAPALLGRERTLSKQLWNYRTFVSRARASFPRLPAVSATRIASGPPERPLKSEPVATAAQFPGTACATLVPGNASLEEATGERTSEPFTAGDRGQRFG
jgi:hypothetical protein